MITDAVPNWPQFEHLQSRKLDHLRQTQGPEFTRHTDSRCGPGTRVQAMTLSLLRVWFPRSVEGVQGHSAAPKPVHFFH